MRSTKKLIIEFVRGYLLEADKPSKDDVKLYDWIYAQVQKDVDMGKVKSDEKSKFGALRDKLSLYSNADLGKGSSRVVFELASGPVMKLALNAAGFAQNGTEAMIGIDPDFSDVVNPVTSMSEVKDYNGWLWITQKKIIPLSEKESGGDWSLFKSMLREAINPQAAAAKAAAEPGTVVAIPKAAAEKRRQENLTTTFINEPFKSLPDDFFYRIKQLVSKYKNSITGDLYKADSWGIDDGKLKLIDYGLTGNIDKDFYQSLEIGEDEKGKKKTALFYGGEKQAKQSMETQRQKSTADKMARLESNAAEVERNPQMSPQEALFRLLQDVVPGLPSELTPDPRRPEMVARPTQLAAVAKVIRSRRDEIEEMISQLSNPQLKDKFYDGIDDYLLTTGELS